MGSSKVLRWDELLAAEGACKSSSNCTRLGVRELFFEPNPGTIAGWKQDRRLFCRGLDRRVVFIAERPSDRRPRDSAADFFAGPQRGWRCWDFTSQDERFREGRARYGFQHCLVTNVVKCGLLGKNASLRPLPEEAASCSGFLVNELELVRPAVVACLGKSALKLFLRFTLPKLSFTPCPVLLTRYSSRNSKEGLFQQWDPEFEILKTALSSRGISTHAPDFISFP